MRRPERSVECSDSEKKMSACADQNHAPSLTCVRLEPELTYKELYDSREHIWSALFMTGYLTQRGEADGNLYQLVIPNREVRNIMTDRVMSLFKENVGKDGEMVNSFCNALLAEDTDKVEELKYEMN